MPVSNLGEIVLHIRGAKEKVRTYTLFTNGVSKHIINILHCK